MSRQANPKQLQALVGEHSLLRATFLRLQPQLQPEDVWVVTTEALADALAAQLPEVPRGQILAEPTGRNTLPAIAWALSTMKSQLGADIAVAVLPSDHYMSDPESFRATLERAFSAVEETGHVMTLGVQPRYAETGYGYLELESEPQELSPVRVTRFTEKPDAETAASFLEGGRHLWNAGIFVLDANVLLDLVQAYQPELAQGLEQIEAAKTQEDVARLYAQLPKESIDTGVMEHHDQTSTLPLSGWSDLGSWEALSELLEKKDGNYPRGDVLAIDSSENILFADEGQIAVLGVEGLVVVRTKGQRFGHAS